MGEVDCGQSRVCYVGIESTEEGVVGLVVGEADCGQSRVCYVGIESTE